MMATKLPEKALHLEMLKKGRFNVPDFIYVPAEDFKNENFEKLRSFLKRHQESFKVIARSAHPLEEAFKPGTLIHWKPMRMWPGFNMPENGSSNGKIGQQTLHFEAAEIQPRAGTGSEDMGIIVMPFINGNGVMAKMLGNSWEFGYCRTVPTRWKANRLSPKPPTTRVFWKSPRRFRNTSVSNAKSNTSFPGMVKSTWSRPRIFLTLRPWMKKEDERSVHLDGIRRIRKRSNYRERPVFVMDNTAFYMDIIDRCENIVMANDPPESRIQDALEIIASQEAECEDFAMRYERLQSWDSP
jgi:hypothetical protein